MPNPEQVHDKDQFVEPDNVTVEVNSHIGHRVKYYNQISNQS